MNQLHFLEFNFVRVPSQSCFVGSDKGGWMYANQRPRYEIKLPEYYILETPIQHRDIALLFNEESNQTDGDVEEILFQQTNELIQKFKQNEDVMQFLKSGDWEVRLPTIAEWQCAFENNIIQTRMGKTELLCDAPVLGNRGAMMDGRPRPNNLIGPAADQLAAIATHPRNQQITALTSVPMDRGLPNVIARIVITPHRKGPAKIVPNNADLSATIRSEVIWVTLLGIIPSFLIPIFRGMEDYAISGWPNLLFGGLVAGFVSGAIWRPKRPTIHFEDGVESTEN